MGRKLTSHVESQLKDDGPTKVYKLIDLNLSEVLLNMKWVRGGSGSLWVTWIT